LFFRASRLVFDSALEPRVRFFVVHIICQTEDIVFFLRFAPRARAFAVQTLLMEYVFFSLFVIVSLFSAFAFFQIRADQK
jgi:hypothetical protein